MGLLDFLFGKKKKQEEALKKEKAARKKAEKERKAAEAEKRRIEKERELFENLLDERTKQLKYYIEQHSEETKKSQEYIKQLVEKTQADDLKTKDSEEQKKIMELEKQLEQKETELKQERVKATMEFYAKQSELEEEMHKRGAELMATLNKLKEEEKLREEGGDYRSAEMIRLEEELKSKEQELKLVEADLAKQRESLDGGEGPDEEMDELMKKQLEDMNRRRDELSTLENQLQAELQRISDMRGQRRDEFTKKLGDLTFDNFVVGNCNEFPFNVCKSVAESPSDAYNPLYIYGSVGLGKTHLLSAIGNQIIHKYPAKIVTYVSSEAFTNELLKAVEENELEEFREKYRSVDVLLVDDIQFIGKTQTTQEEFFHTFNSLYNANKQIIIASDRPPKEIQTLEDRLRSRFEGGLITDIKPPEDKTRTKILMAKAEKDGVKIPKDVLEYMSKSISSNMRTLIGALNKVTAYAKLTDSKMDVDMAKGVLSDVLEEEAKLEGGPGGDGAQ